MSNSQLPTPGFIPYGGNKTDGSHDHRYNSGEDRTPAQKEGDEKRRRDSSNDED